MSESIENSGVLQPLTPAGAAQYLGLDVKTITRWARQGYLPAHPLGEGKRKFWRFLVSELSAWLNDKNNNAGRE
jgi:excisionase family DNA binding protein